ncbi:phosphotransferase [Blastococcus xanthinilyticus]|uniref:Phosphotransferase family enzyme n=1 Tax=Blastococcus xanthinilyticus TaxID=1564164 RepID=A0A5S5CVU6_9ACTN|nr:phosphotransferase [Blastococcus xanthinilyticus]TYP87214.1 phosphotransferase family enzyme [Blastococcus xanthinilyticus]
MNRQVWGTARATAVRPVRHPALRRPGRTPLARAAGLVPAVLGEAARLSGLDGVAGWRPESGTWTSTGTATFPVGPAGAPAAAVLRLTTTGADRLRSESRALAALASAPALRGLLPVRHAEGPAAGWWYVLDSHVGGVDATAALAAAPGLRPAVLGAATAVITGLHRATAVPLRVDDVVLDRWVDEPIRRLVRSGSFPLRTRPAQLDRLRRRLRDGLHGRRVQATRIHGDFWLGNVRVDPGTGAVAGVIDWDTAGEADLPAHDLLHLALYGAALEQGVDLGAVVAGALVAGTLPPAAEESAAAGRWAWEGVDDDVVVLLYWLRHVAAMAAQHRGYAEHTLLGWHLRNVRTVLRCL